MKMNKGRRKFLTLYAGIYLLPPLLLVALARWMPGQLAAKAPLSRRSLPPSAF